VHRSREKKYHLHLHLHRGNFYTFTEVLELS
jgi:hypothetical protein